MDMEQFCFEDEEVVDGLQEQFPLYKIALFGSNHQNATIYSLGRHRVKVWSITTTLQSWIDDEVKESGPLRRSYWHRCLWNTSCRAQRKSSHWIIDLKCFHKIKHKSLRESNIIY